MRTGSTRTSTLMRKTHSVRWGMTVGLAAVGLLASACGSTSGGSSSAAAAAAGTPSISAGALLGTETTPIGTILVDGRGKSVYVFAADQPGQSNCSGSCLTYWPPVTAPATLPPAPAGVTAKLGVITRSDGTHQLTVDGWPVYTYAGDSGPGATSGQGTNLSGGLWWVVSPAGSQIKTTSAASSKPASPSKSSSGGGWA